MQLVAVDDPDFLDGTGLLSTMISDLGSVDLILRPPPAVLKLDTNKYVHDLSDSLWFEFGVFDRDLCDCRRMPLLHCSPLPSGD